MPEIVEQTARRVIYTFGGAGSGIYGRFCSAASSVPLIIWMPQNVSETNRYASRFTAASH